MCRSCAFCYGDNPDYSAGKLKYNSMNFVQNVSCINFVYTTTSSICLNTATLFDLNLLTLPLMLPLVCKSDHIQNPIFCALIDSKSTYCFIDTTFAWKYNISINLTLLVELKLFNGLLNKIISETTFLSVIFPSSD